MQIKLNGEIEELSKEITLLELISKKGLDPQKIVIEHNLKIIKKKDLDQVNINENDTIEIVSFLGGGQCRTH